MNEKIEEIYTQMFAPQPIPQVVKELYARAQHFADRIDSPQVPTSMLVMIAAVATVTAKSTKPVKVDIDEIAGTKTIQPDSYASNEAPGPLPEPSNEEDDYNGPAESSAAATGAMDVPAVVHKGDDARRYKDLIRLSMPELREHCREFYAYRPRVGYKKSKIIEMIMKRKPVK